MNETQKTTQKRIVNILNTYDISFMALGDMMKNAGIDYVFSTEQPMPPHYKTSDGVTVCSVRYVDTNDKDCVTVGDIAVG